MGDRKVNELARYCRSADVYARKAICRIPCISCQSAPTHVKGVMVLPVVHVSPPTQSRNECCSSIYLSGRSHTCEASCGAPGTACQSAHAPPSRPCTRHEGKQLFGGRCPPLHHYLLFHRVFLLLIALHLYPAASP